MTEKWDTIKKQIIDTDNLIFANVDKNTLSDYEKRKMIFEYLGNVLDYDNERLIDIILASKGITFRIKKNIITKEQAKKEVLDYLIDNNLYDNDLFNLITNRIDNNLLTNINASMDLENVMKTKKCLCHSGSQFYKLLLEYNDIYAACVFCDNNMPVPHQLTLVYDKDNDSYSFDDLSTYTALKKTQNVTINQFFDYDYDYLEKLYEENKENNQENNILNQGHKTIFTDSKGVNLNWFINPSEVVNYNAGKEDQWYLQFDLEKDGNIYLPNNICSIKNKSITK